MRYFRRVARFKYNLTIAKKYSEKLKIEIRNARCDLMIACLSTFKKEITPNLFAIPETREEQDTTVFVMLYSARFLTEYQQ